MDKPLHKNVCEESVFRALYSKHAKNLHDFVYYKYGERFDPEDKVHEAFIKLWENCKNIAPSKAKSFLFTVINNLSLNTAKHEKIVLKYRQEPQKTVTQQSPQYLLEEKEYLQKFERALANLTEAQRVAFMLNRVEGKKHKEIAELLNISQKAVEKRIYGALEKLRNDIEGL